MNKEQLKEIAAQLSCPRGEDGIRTADMMHSSNLGMTMNTANELNITDNDIILELGHGNGRHIKQVLAQAKNVVYHGLEISELMSNEASLINTSENTSFHLYDGKNIPFDMESFTKVMTVNTIYFWQNPVELINQIYSILKKEGIFCIGFAEKEFMEMLPFTQYGFTLYDQIKLRDLINQTPFKLMNLNNYTEQIQSKANEMVERIYTVASLQKV